MKEREEMKSVNLFGYGWLGKAFIDENNQNYNFKIFSRQEKENRGNIEFIKYDLSNPTKEIYEGDILVFMLPTRSDEVLSFFNSLDKKILAKKEQVIFISSTSIYLEENKEFDEEGEIKKDINLSKIEQIFRELNNATIFRCGGLMGYDRFGAKYFSNKEVKNSKNKVNFVHRDDVIKAINLSLEKKAFGIFNLCSKFHPSKEELYKKEALEMGIDIFGFDKEGHNPDRIIMADKISKKLGFLYEYENPLKYKYI